MTVLLAIALAMASVPATEPKAAGASAAQVEKLVLDGKAEEAIEKGRAAVAAHPDDVGLRLALARALAAKARHAKRLVSVPVSQKDVAKGQVAVPGADLDRAKLQVDYDKDLFEEALGHLDHAIKRQPQRQDLRVFQCFLLTDSGSIDRAATAIANALAALPRSDVVASTMASYGAERAKREDPAGAAQLLAPVVDAFPKNASVLVDYGNVLTRLGKKVEAFAAFDRATAIAPKEARYVRTKAVSAMLLRDFRRAQGAFDEAYALGQGGADQLASLAAAYGVEPKASAGPARRVVAQEPPADPSVTDLAKRFVAAATAGPSSRDALTLARTLIGSQQDVLAIPVLDRMIRAAPGNSEAKTMLKTVYGNLGCATLAPR